MKYIPNLITATNLLLGCLAAVRLWEGNYRLALIFFILALLMDWLDGFAAYLLKAHSELGKQLDSLADMVTFGFLPGLIWYTLLSDTTLSDWSWLGFLYTVAAAFRLAKFNIDQNQSIDFSGLPSPAAALFSLGYFYWWQQNVYGYREMLELPYIVLSFLAIACLLMVATLPMFSLKIKRLTWEGNAIKFIFVGITIPILIIWKLAVLLPLIGIYILISLVKWLFWKKNNS